MRLDATPPPPDEPNASPFDASNTPYAAIGGEAGVRQLVDTFYDHMDAEESVSAVRRLHQADLAEARQKLFEFLSGWLGGPGLYVQRYGHPRLRQRHAPFPVGEVERDQWLACMQSALDACDVSGELRTFLDARFAHVANFLRNQ